MYISLITIENFRCFGAGNNRLELKLTPGLTAIVGENDSGKSAVMDALRLALGTTDQDWLPLEETDFYGGATDREIKIVIRFDHLNGKEKAAFLEFLTYEEGDAYLLVHWTAKDMGGNPTRAPLRQG